MQKPILVIPLFLVALLTVSCTLSDDERCQGDLIYDDLYGGCRLETPFDNAVTKAEGTDTGAGILNLSCQSSADCIGNGAMTFCLIGPAEDNVCTVSPCSTGGCQSKEFMCYDCTSSQLAPFFPYPVCAPRVLEADLSVMGCRTGMITANTDTEIDTSGQVAGVFMLECNSDAECANNGSMTYCLANALDASAPGACVQDNCVPDACPVGQECCDCSNSTPNFGWESAMCWDEAMNDGPYSIENFGCVCTPNTTVPDTDTGTATDSVDTDTSTTAAVGVAGVSCSSDVDCAANGQVDYCLANPFDTAAPGTCFQDACTAGACEVAGEECCDCTAVAFIDWPSNLCMPAEMLTGPYGLETAGCTCD